MINFLGVLCSEKTKLAVALGMFIGFPVQAAERPVIKEGGKGLHVQHLQKMLNTVAVPQPHLSEDGIFGARTKAAVVAFQTEHGLSADGIVGAGTWEFIDRPLVKQGSTGAHVIFLQGSLNRILGPSMAVSVDGNFGPSTKQAVTDFQKVSNLTSDGIVGDDTWNVIYRSPSFDLTKNETVQELRKAARETKVAVGTREWTTKDILLWKSPIIGNKEYLMGFKKQWVTGYKDVINAAAKRYGIPPVLLAGVAFNEVAGDPLWVDEFAYQVRNFDHLADPELEPLTLTEKPEKTSFGNVSMQIRRAAETLGLDIATLPSSQKRDLINLLKGSRENIFLAARHLAKLRDIDYSGRTAQQLTVEEIEVVGTRFNRGSELSLAKIKENLSYGKAISKRFVQLKDMLKQQ